jgi:hypothetical protein
VIESPGSKSRYRIGRFQFVHSRETICNAKPTFASLSRHESGATVSPASSTSFDDQPNRRISGDVAARVVDYSH